MRVEEFTERNLHVAGWEIVLTTYRLGEIFHCKADNAAPGATLARTSAPSKEEAEEKAVKRAEELLLRAKRRPRH